MAFWATRYSAAQTQISHTHILLIKASLNVCFEVRQSVCVCVCVMHISPFGLKRVSCMLFFLHASVHNFTNSTIMHARK